MAGNEEKFKHAMNLGHSAAWDLEWEQAANYYRQALAEFPENTQALSNLGAALFELQEYDEALQCYQKVAQASPHDPLPLEKISQIYEQQGALRSAGEYAFQAAELHLQSRDTQKAIENWIRCEQLAPQHLRTHSRLALVYERLGKKPQAVTEYLAVASLLQKAGKNERASELIEHALKLLPGSREARQALKSLKSGRPLPLPALLHQHEKHTHLIKSSPAPVAAEREQPAEEEETSTQDPLIEARQRALTELATMVFDYEETEERRDHPLGLEAITKGSEPLSEISGNRTHIMLHLSQAVDLQTQNDEEQAAEELERAIEAGLDSPAAHFTLGVLRANLGRWESALRQLQFAVKNPAYALASRLLAGQILQKLGRYGEATLEYLEGLKIADSSVVPPEKATELRQLYEPIIEAQAQTSDEEAHKEICTSLEQLLLQPDWRTRVRQARQQLPPSDGGPLIPLAEVLTQAKGGEFVELLTHIHQLARRGHLRVAMEEAFWALQFAPSFLPLHNFMAELLLQEDQLQEAVAKYSVVARAYSARGETERAISLLRKITQLTPLDIAARQQLIEHLSSAGMYEEAVREYLEMGDVYYRLAELDKARETYQKALNLTQRFALEPHWTVQVLHHLADIDLQRLDWRQALRLFEQIRKLNPDDEDAAARVIDLNLRLGQEQEALNELNNYLLYLNTSAQTERAVNLLEYLLQNYPEQIAMQRALAEQYTRAGRIEAAIAQWDIIGDKLLELGDKQGTIQAIEAILALHPQNEADYRSILQDLKAEI
jgi:tetratricopeptide (TPR) repeat protein